MREESFPRPLAAVSVTDHLVDTVALEILCKLLYDGLGTEWRFPLTNQIKHRAVALAVCYAERHRIL